MTGVHKPPRFKSAFSHHSPCGPEKRLGGCYKPKRVVRATVGNGIVSFIEKISAQQMTPHVLKINTVLFASWVFKKLGSHTMTHPAARVQRSLVSHRIPHPPGVKPPENTPTHIYAPKIKEESKEFFPPKTQTR